MAGQGWVFDSLPDSLAKRGGSPEEHVFSLSIDTLVREVLQNSHDQRLGEGEPVRVEFRLHDLKEEAKSRLLAAIDWDVLEGHLAGMAAERGPLGDTFKRELSEIRNREFLRVLYVYDKGAKGLIGSEDASASNFGALCRHVLNTSEDDQERGGSFGLGKAVLWAFSGVSTVICTSRLSEADRHGSSRLFGRTNLAYHKAAGQDWGGLGFFGQPDPQEGRRRSVSVWGDEAESSAEAMGMPFPWDGNESGTGILLFDFDEPEEEEDRGLLEIATDIQEAASRWFWPCLKIGSLAVRTTAFDGLDQVFDEESTLDLEEIAAFVQLVGPGGEQQKERLSGEGDWAQRGLSVRVPQQKASGTDVVDDEGDSPAVLRVGLSGAESRWSERIALVRGSGMVVEYWKPPSTPDSDLNLYGICLAGLILSRLGLHHDEECHRLERFLRAAEPPSHNEWVATTRRVQRDYGWGSKAAVNKLFTDIRSHVRELCGTAPPPGDQGPDGLRKRLDPGRGPTPPRVPKVELEHATASFDDRTKEWSVEGEISRRATDEPWLASLCLMLATDGGSNIQQRLDLGSSGSLTDGVTCTLEDRFLLISVPAGKTKANFKVWSSPLNKIELESSNPKDQRGSLSVVASRTGLSVDVKDASKRKRR